jgi:hypothetical protein
MILMETILMDISLYMIGTALGGMVFACIVEMIVFYVCSKRGQLEPRRMRYYCWCQIWVIMTQVSAFAVLRYPSVSLVLPEMLRGMYLPLVSFLYSAVATWTCRKMNRALLAVGMPVNALSGLPYMVLAVAQCFIICAFLPKYVQDDWRIEQRFDMFIVIVRWVSAAMTTVVGDLVKRGFILQRIKFHILTRILIRCGKTSKPLQIQPEMDTLFRGSFTSARMQFVTALVFVITAMPGEAPWTKEPLVWIGLAIAFFVMSVSDVVIVMYHRIYFPVKGENYFGTQWRLSNPLQHYPHLQSDGGSNYEKWRKLAEGQIPDDEITQSATAARLVSCNWSSHWFFTDARIMQILCSFVAAQLLMAGFVAVYGYCGMWYDLDYVYCSIE